MNLFSTTRRQFTCTEHNKRNDKSEALIKHGKANRTDSPNRHRTSLSFGAAGLSPLAITVVPSVRIEEVYRFFDGAAGSGNSAF
jgi:hypothetical protein